MLKYKIDMQNILADLSEVEGTNVAALGVGCFGLLTSPTSALGRVTPHHRLVRRLAPGPGRSNLDLVGLGEAGGALNDEGDFATVDEVVTEAKDNETIIQKAREHKKDYNNKEVKPPPIPHPKPLHLMNSLELLTMWRHLLKVSVVLNIFLASSSDTAREGKILLISFLTFAE